MAGGPGAGDLQRTLMLKRLLQQQQNPAAPTTAAPSNQPVVSGHKIYFPDFRWTATLGGPEDTPGAVTPYVPGLGKRTTF